MMMMMMVTMLMMVMMTLNLLQPTKHDNVHNLVESDRGFQARKDLALTGGSQVMKVLKL